MTLEEIKREAIIKTLYETNFNIAHAARRLAISLRAMRYKLREYEREGYLARRRIEGV